MRLAARGSALDTGGVTCGEKLNRSLCSLKIKILLDGTVLKKIFGGGRMSKNACDVAKI